MNKSRQQGKREPYRSRSSAASRAEHTGHSEGAEFAEASPEGSDIPSKAPPKLRPAKHYALWLLGRREWSAKELEQRLRFKGYLAADIEVAIEFCQKHGLQSDNRFAASKVRTREASHGNRRISQELALKGISEETRTEALSEAGDECVRAEAAARRFEGRPWSLELKSKAWRFLMSRGFSSTAVAHALKGLQQSASAGAGAQVGAGSDLDADFGMDADQ